MKGRRVLMPADVRFPLERANGVQIVKTAAALVRAGAPTELLVAGDHALEQLAWNLALSELVE